jgi:endogenous inhibitor of DNA gyrase (YacG/DUF329 family)
MTTGAIGPARRVPCPGCRQPALFHPDNPWRPFCSELCRRVDLGAWASERFRVAAAVDPAPNAIDADPANPA